MLKKYPILKWSLVTVLSLIVFLFCFGYWFISLIRTDDNQKDLKTSSTSDLVYLSKYQGAPRGKILAVVTSWEVMGKENKRTGYELTELARAYYVFKANGFEVDIASPKGGKPSVIIDGDDMGAFDYAFLNDSVAQYKANHTMPVDEVVAEDYEAVFFAGGKGAMFDFPENTTIQAIIREHYQSGKVVGAVCHGPAALVNVMLDDGSALLSNKTVSGFTNEEELFLIPEAESIFPFLLQDKMEAQGASFKAGPQYLLQVSQDKNLITGQNPWSTWAMAETMIEQLGYQPIERANTAEENGIEVLTVYTKFGYDQASDKIKTMLSQEHKPVNRQLIAMHSIVAAMQWKVGKSFDLICLLATVKGQ